MRGQSVERKIGVFGGWVAVAMLTLPTVAQGQPEKNSAAVPKSAVVATVDGAPVTRAELFSHLLDRQLVEVVEAVVESRVAEVETKRLGIKLPEKLLMERLAIWLEHARSENREVTPHLRRAIEDELRSTLGWHYIYCHDQGIDPDAAPAGNASMMQEFVKRKVMDDYRVTTGGLPSDHLASIAHGRLEEPIVVTRSQVSARLAAGATKRGVLLALHDLIDQRLIDNAARAAGVTVTDEDVDGWASAMKAKHPPPFTWEKICEIKGTSAGAERIRWRRVQLYMKLVKPKLDEAARIAFKDANRGFFTGSTRKISLIAVPDGEVADVVIKRLRDGDLFEEVAADLSIDEDTAAANGLLARPIKSIYPGLDRALVKGVFALESEGDVSEPIRGLAEWYVVRLNEINDAPANDVNMDDPRYSDWVAETHDSELMRAWVRGLRERAKVEVAGTATIWPLR